MNKFTYAFVIVAFCVVLNVFSALAQTQHVFSVYDFQSPVAKNHKLNQAPGGLHEPKYSIDIGALNRDVWDDPVYAMAAGTVDFVGWDATGYGNTVVLNHGGGWYSRYGHLSGFSTQYLKYYEGEGYRVKHAQTDASFVVGHGQQVSKGQLIGFMGSTGTSTGAHLHLEYFNYNRCRLSDF